MYVNNSIDLQSYDADEKKTIEDEAYRCMDLEYFTLVKCFDVWKTQDEKLNIISEYIAGENLAEKIKMKGDYWSEREVLNIFKSICSTV